MYDPEKESFQEQRRPDFSQIDPETRRMIEMTPDEARQKLEALFCAYDPETVERLHEQFRAGSSGSHEVRALLRIAEGEEPRLFGEVYWELREEDGLTGNSY